MKESHRWILERVPVCISEGKRLSASARTDKDPLGSLAASVNSDAALDEARDGIQAILSEQDDD